MPITRSVSRKLVSSKPAVPSKPEEEPVPTGEYDAASPPKPPIEQSPKIKDETYEARSVCSLANSAAVRAAAVRVAKAKLEEARAATALAEAEAAEIESGYDVKSNAESRIHDWLDGTPRKTAKKLTQQQSHPLLEKSTTHPGGTMEASTLAAALVEAARNTSSHAPLKFLYELPFFNGTSSEWLTFKAAYRDTKDRFSKIDNLIRLRKCLKGAAKEAVLSQFVADTDPDEVMRRLETRFGRPDSLVIAEIDKLRTLRKLTDNPQDVCIFASKVNNIVAVVQALHKMHYLYNPEAVRLVVEKLTPAIKYRWYDYAAERSEDEPDLLKLSSFLSREAELCSLYAQAENTAPQIQKEKAYSSVESSSVKPQKTRECPVCKGNHCISDCAEFLELDVDSRWNKAKQSNLCFRCLSKRNFRHRCKYRACGTEECKGSHHPLLHTERRPDEAPAVVATAHHGRSALLKILPVRIRGPNSSMDTFALLDEGSTVTLVEDSIAQAIGATGSIEPFTIEGVGGARVGASYSRRVKLFINGKHKIEKEITARTIKKLDLAPQTVTEQSITEFEYLNEIAQDLTYHNATPRILIGQDNWNLIVSKQVKSEGPDKPAASLTELGWVLHGPFECGRQRVHTVAKASYCDYDNDDEHIEDLMWNCFDLHNIGIEHKRPQNDPDDRALNILKNQSSHLLDSKPARGVFWTDSRTVRAWLRAGPRTYKPFVAHQVAEIEDETKVNEWRWLPSAFNVADDATPKRTKRTGDDNVWKPTISRQPNKQLQSRPSKLLITDRMITLEAKHILTATKIWWKATQEQDFLSDLCQLREALPLHRDSPLKTLSVILDIDGIIRLKSRIDAAIDLSYDQRHPPVLNGNNLYTRLYIGHIHKKKYHAGTETVVNEVRSRLWVLPLRPITRTIVKSCMKCRIIRAKPAIPVAGDHPNTRLAHHQRPFSFIGLDYFGPCGVTVGRRHEKRYVALFTCLTTRAIHVEVAGSLSSDSAIMALRRMMARRGCPAEIHSDNGTNLRGADTELRKAAIEATKEEAASHTIRWRYIPPGAPFMGGVWERMVQSVKRALAATLNERYPTEEVLTTLLLEAEYTVNNRPLTPVSTSPDDPEALTPLHFILGGPARVPQPGSFNDSDFNSRNRWRHTQRLADIFWTRWVREYAPLLQYRRDPQSRGRVPQIGDVVLLIDENLPRNTWPRGQITATFPGKDGIIRIVEVRRKSGLFRRAVNKVVILTSTNDN